MRASAFVLLLYSSCPFTSAINWGSKKVEYPQAALGHTSVSRPATKINLTLKRSQNRLGASSRAAELAGATQFRADFLKNTRDERATIVVPPSTKIIVTSAESAHPIKEWRTALFKMNNVTDPEYWALTYNGETLDEDSRLDDLASGSETDPIVPYGAELTAIPISKPARTITLKITAPNGKSRWLDPLPVTSTVDDLYTAVGKALSLPDNTFDLFDDKGVKLDDLTPSLEAKGIVSDTNLTAKEKTISVPVLLPNATFPEPFTMPLSATAKSLLAEVKKKNIAVDYLTFNEQQVLPATALSTLSYSTSNPFRAVIKGSAADATSIASVGSVGSTVTTSSSIKGDSVNTKSLAGAGDVSGVQSLASAVDEDMCAPTSPQKMDNGMWRGADLLQPCCDPAIEGFESCASNTETYGLVRQYYSILALICVVCLCVLIILIVIVQTFARTVVQRLTKAEDRYMRELVEAAFRQISAIAIASAILHIICTWDIIQVRLDTWLFRNLLSSVHFETELFDRIEYSLSHMQLLIDDFVLVYSAFVLLFCVLAYIDFKWLKKADDLTVEEIVVNYSNTDFIDYVTARYEYLDRVSGREIGGLDPKYCWFMEYYRACLVLTSMTLIRFPNITLLLLMIPISLFFLLAHPEYHITGGARVLAALMANAIPILILLGVLIRTNIIHKQVLPADPVRYASLRYQLEAGKIDPTSTDETTGQSYAVMLHESQPRYKSEPAPPPITGWYAKYIYGTRYPSRHENLFVFKRKGPHFLLRLTESAFLICMMVSSYTLNEIDSVPAMWWSKYGYWPVIGFIALVAITAAFLPKILSRLTYVSCTGMMLNEEVLSDVMISSRSLFVSRLSLFVDGLRIEALFRKLKATDDNFWRDMSDLVANADEDDKFQKRALWERLTYETDDLITPPILYSFLNRQGLNIPSEKAVMSWFEVFDPTRKGGIDEDSFYKLIVVLTELLREPLDLTAVRELLIEDWNILPNSVTGITSHALAEMLDHLKMKWTENQRIHLITFLAKNGNARSIDFDFFLQRLAEVEASTLTTLNQAVQKMRGDPNTGTGETATEEPELQEAL